MLKNIAIKGIQPPRLNAQTAVVPADQQQTMVKIISFHFTSKFINLVFVSCYKSFWYDKINVQNLN